VVVYAGFIGSYQDLTWLYQSQIHQAINEDHSWVKLELRPDVVISGTPEWGNDQLFR